jgi:thiol-disulfide isomerase/thioredoxin/Tfp pilus assembly protein PilF
MKASDRLRRQLSGLLLMSSVLPAPAQQNPPARDPAVKQELERGQSALAHGQYADAIRDFENAGKLAGPCPECEFGEAVAYLRTGQSDKALESADRALASARDDRQRVLAHNLKANIYLDLSSSDGKKLARAAEEYRLAVELAPRNPLLHRNLALTLLKQGKDGEAVEELKQCLELGPDAKTAEEVRQLIADPRRGRGDFAPDFQFTSLQGQEISRHALAGRVVVMDFWATWCPPCRAAVPELKDLTKKYPRDRLVLVSVSVDEDERAWRDFVAANGMDWPQYRDSDHQIIDAFRVYDFPTYLVIDREGIVRQRIVGVNPHESVVSRLKSTLHALPELKDAK